MRKALDGHSLRSAHGIHVTTNESFAGEPVEADVTGMQSALDSSLSPGSPTLRPRRSKADCGQIEQHR